MTFRRFTAAVLAAAITLSVSACNNSADNTEQGFGLFGSAGGNTAKGDYVVFGDYNWQVLEVRNGNALIISERILDYLPYNKTAKASTWADCDLREYLNGEFYNSFSDEDKSRIILTKNNNPDNPWDFTGQGGNAFTEGGEDTEDYIFLLSLDDIVEYYTDDGKNSMLYEAKLGAHQDTLSDGSEKDRIAYQLSGQLGTTPASSWFLRSPGMYTDTAACITNKGRISVMGTLVDTDRCGVRPVMWVKNAGALEKSVICNNPDCKICNSNLYKDNYNPETDGSCPVCGYANTECSDKQRHNRLFHDWSYNNVLVTEEMIEEMKKVEEQFNNVWSSIGELIKDAASRSDSSGKKTRISVVISPDTAVRLTDLMIKETMVGRQYRSMTPKQFEKKKEELINRTAMLKEVRSTIQKAIKKANDSALTFEQSAAGLFKAIAIEILRTEVKNVSSETNEQLWEAGYYHALFGDKLAGIAYDEFEQLSQDEIDKLFGNDKIKEWGTGGEAILDGYIEAVFFS